MHRDFYPIRYGYVIAAGTSLIARIIYASGWPG
jgi:hypothetical protein